MNDLNSLVSRYELQHQSAVDRLARELLARDKARNQIISIELGQKIVQAVAQAVQESAHSQIASVVTRAIRAVFGGEYEFFIRFEQKRGKTEARLVFEKNGEEISPLHGSGGGLLDVAAFFLNIICILMTRPLLRRLFVADAPLKHLDRDRAEAVRGLIEELSKELEVQIIMVTHSPELACGTIISL